MEKFIRCVPNVTDLILQHCYDKEFLEIYAQNLINLRRLIFDGIFVRQFSDIRFSNLKTFRSFEVQDDFDWKKFTKLNPHITELVVTADSLIRAFETLRKNLKLQIFKISHDIAKFPNIQKLSGLNVELAVDDDLMSGVPDCFFNDSRTDVNLYKQIDILDLKIKNMNCANQIVSLQIIYDFAKMLLRNGVDVFEKYEPINPLNQKPWEYLLQAIVPLCSYVRVPLELALNESKSWIEDYHDCKNEGFTRGVVSLKNLTRTTIRKHFFQNGNVYERLTALHSMKLPRLIINFICYNDDNLKFKTSNCIKLNFKKKTKKESINTANFAKKKIQLDETFFN
ncbi:hypothetical protein Bhyg_08761 [Pseudolycoriella hygida]|uniref:Uncharacterized protein n=1 Tax=Pseudolycoriella hygida TaxID=35572 RepID=A0A9Q0N690_9DIPT|nr:hypothetical protein Bhyg_08761 [Pseudolycoriella hygida]